jgi:hypothetical protein
MTVIELPDEQAATQGLTLEAWFKKLAAESDATDKATRSPREAAAHILELQKHVKPDPEGGR